MCLMIVKEKGIRRPSWDKLLAGWNGNSDGAGVAWTKGDGFVEFKKFLEWADFKRFLKSDAEFVGKENEYAILYHFRFATHGSVKLENIHPFVLSESPRDILKTEGKARAVVAHNGIISKIGTDPHLDFSDTMMMVRDFLSRKPIRENMEDPAIQELLEEYIGYSKIAILYGTGKFVFVNKAMGINEKDGVWYSNSGYKSYHATHYTSANQVAQSLFPPYNQKGTHSHSHNPSVGPRDDDEIYDKWQEEFEEHMERDNSNLEKIFKAKKKVECDYCLTAPYDGKLLPAYGGEKICTECHRQYYLT